jgi:FixJ family two-component response regulator
MSTARPTIFVVDDDASIRAALTRLLKAGGFEPQVFATATEFLGRSASDAPGCAIVDLRMPGPSGMDLLEALAVAENPLPVVFLTGHGDIPTSVKAMRQGAVDFLTKPVNKQQLFDAVERALTRDAVERKQRAHLRELRARYDSLSPREREVFTLVVAGKLNKQIADNFGTSIGTIKVQRKRVMVKMQVESVAELVHIAEQLGMLAGAFPASA